MHHPAAGRGKGVAAVHHATIVPNHDVARLPLVMIRPLADPVDVFPDRIQQLFGFPKIETFDTCVLPSADIQRLLPCLGMGTNRRMPCPRQLLDVEATTRFDVL